MTTITQALKQTNIARGYKYILSLPPTYASNDSKQWPLILFLHGAAEYGSSIDKIKKNGIPKLIRDYEHGIANEAAKIVSEQFITVSPQCDNPSRWNAEILYKLMEEVYEKYGNIDRSKVFLTGISMGGNGTWKLSIYSNLKKNDQFTAIVPICGWIDRLEEQNLGSIVHIPTWNFHGAKDDIIEKYYSDLIVRSLKEKHGHKNIKYTVYPNANHDSWTETYNNVELYSWLLKHK